MFDNMDNDEPHSLRKRQRTTMEEKGIEEEDTSVKIFSNFSLCPFRLINEKLSAEHHERVIILK